MKNIYLIIYLSMLLFSCKTQNLFVEAKGDKIVDSLFCYNEGYQYKIRKDDKISISVWGQEDFSIGSVYGIYNSNEVYGKWLMVDADGNIEVPKLGTKHVYGETIIQIKDSLKKELKKWIINPVVDVRVLNKEITVLGEVKTPGVVNVDKDHNSLVELIGKTGGFEFYANLKHIKIIRQEGSDVRITNLDLTHAADYVNKNILLHPGDIVIVPSKRYKEFDKRISVIIPFTTAISAAAIILKLF